MSDLQPVHLVVDRLVQTTIGRRNKHDGDMDVIDTLAPSVNEIGIPGKKGGGNRQGPKNPTYDNAKELAERIWLHLLTAPAGTQVQFIKPGTSTVNIIIPEVKRDGELP